MVNDGIGNGNFTTLKPFAFWTQHVLPLVYGDEISYMETLGKMRDILNELIKNNNNLPEYIQQMIEEYISSGAIEEVIDNILASFILNVKFPPTGIPKAKGDGTTNDHDSIQGCIDYAAANGGGIVYLPAGKYLTSPLVLKSGVTLLGFGRYAVSLVLAGGATTHLITGTVSDAGILNMTLDAKMSSQVNRVDAIELIGNHIDIRGCLVRDCYTSINVQKDGTAVNICDVICEVASDACLRIGGTDGGLLVDGLEMTGLSTNLGVAYLVTDSNGDIYRNINIHGTGALGIDVSGSGNYFDGKISGVTKDYDDISGDNTFNLFGKTRVENLTGEVNVSANEFSQTAVNGIERQGANISDNAVNTHTINAKDLVLNPINPLTYKTPTQKNKYFNSVPMKDNSSTYDVLVWNNETSKLQENYGALYDYPMGGASMSSFYSYHYPNTEPSVVQGFTVHDNDIIMCMWKEDNNVVIRIKSMIDGTEIRKSGTLAIGHANSAEWYNNKLYIASDTRIFIVDYATLTLERTITLTPTATLASAFHVNGQLQAYEGTGDAKIINVNEDGTYSTAFIFNPQPFGTGQSASYNNGFYYLASIIPSTIQIYDSDGNLINYTMTEQIVSGNLYNELEGIGFYNDSLILAFHNDTYSEGIANLAVMRFDNSTRMYKAPNREITLSPLTQTVFLDNTATNTICDGTEQFPFHTDFEAMTYLKYKFGGNGIIQLKTGTTYNDFTVYGCDVSIIGTGCTINNFSINNATVEIINCTLNVTTSNCTNSTVRLVDCQLTVSNVLNLYRTMLFSNEPLTANIYCNPNSYIFGSLRNKNINIIARDINTFLITEKVNKGDIICNYTQIPKEFSCIVHTGQQLVSFSVTFEGNTGDPVFQSNTYTVGDDYYEVIMSFTCGNNSLKYESVKTIKTDSTGNRSVVVYDTQIYEPFIQSGRVTF